jgi:hypothetical protein
MRNLRWLAALMVLGCTSITGPYGDVTSSISVTPASVAPGGSVSIEMIARNTSADTVDTNHSCAPGLGFEVTGPSGARRDPMSEGAWDCPLLDSQILEPFETDTVRFSWTTPAETGVYRLRAGARSATGLQALSEPALLEVR